MASLNSGDLDMRAQEIYVSVKDTEYLHFDARNKTICPVCSCINNLYIKPNPNYACLVCSHLIFASGVMFQEIRENLYCLSLLAQKQKTCEEYNQEIKTDWVSKFSDLATYRKTMGLRAEQERKEQEAIKKTIREKAQATARAVATAAAAAAMAEEQTKRQKADEEAKAIELIKQAEQKKANEEARLRKLAEDKARQEAVEQARKLAEEKAKQEAEEQATWTNTSSNKKKGKRRY